MAKNTTKMTAAQKAKISALKPVINFWNKCIGDTWTISRPNFETDSVIIHRAKPCEDFHDHIHGSLLTGIAGICNAYTWAWAVYNDSRYNGINVNI